MTTPIAKAQGREGSLQQSFEFDIPAGPLVDALDRYTVLTGRPTLYPSALVAGRTASSVQGRHDASTALRLLLQGSGLVIEEIRDGAVEALVLKQAPAGDAVPASNSHIPNDEYDALVQSRAWATFCADQLTAPGSYRALLRFNIDAGGRVRRARLLGSTGSAPRDRLLTAALAGLEIGQPPPAGLVQPLTLLILPQGQMAGRTCASGAP
ncbi:hypothetical protein [Herbaspirillum sp. alder98]|uniref:hypothetical protein n=1 Tax=Herbaspirillum sp. alder98 TaxID=2913096 RepID=UPI001CD8D8E6|nr:hypothetical protein [Herbaspirillum sp. alder98]MCA1325591.1 hypothetical protein [Herbaspirillum sp. alder98]